jgi:hypothetical protein
VQYAQSDCDTFLFSILDLGRTLLSIEVQKWPLQCPSNDCDGRFLHGFCTKMQLTTAIFLSTMFFVVTNCLIKVLLHLVDNMM